MALLALRCSRFHRIYGVLDWFLDSEAFNLI